MSDGSEVLKDFKHVAARLGGYKYQFQVAILRLIDLLARRVELVILERTHGDDDVFDDIKVHLKGEIHHYQVKWGMKQDKALSLSDFTNDSSSLDLVDLFSSWRSYLKANPKIRHFIHVYTSKDLSSNDEITDILIDASTDAKKFTEVKQKASQFNAKIWKKGKSTQVRKRLKQLGATSKKLNEFLESLVIETGQPWMPGSEKEEESQGNPMQDLILQRISNDLGLDKPPHKRRLVEVCEALFYECYDSARFGRRITRNELATRLNIHLDFRAIPQDFDFEENVYIETPSILEELTDKIRQSSGKIIGIIGRPGAGKSWLLTHWVREQQKHNPKLPALMYYCFTKVTGDEYTDIRVTQQQLIQNLVNDILRYYPQLENQPNDLLLAATKERLQYLLDQLGNYAKSQDVVIPIIIDGLDHIRRIRKRSSKLRPEEEDILNFLNDLKVPNGISVAIGTQPGDHIVGLKSKYGHESFIEINGFSKIEAEQYLAKFGISEANGTDPEIIRTIIEKADGLPLLLAYIVQASRVINLEERKASMLDVATSLQNTQGDIKKYYEWLWQGFSSASPTRLFARLLALLDFPASVDLLNAIIPLEERLDEPLEKCLNPLYPLLKKTDEGISFFHDSFRTFILEDQTYTEDTRVRYYKKLYNYLMKLDIHKNNISFRKALEFAYLAGMDNEILQTVSLEFVDKAFEIQCPINEILSNIDFAIKAAVRKCDLSMLVSNCLLRKYTKERFDYNIPIEGLAKILVKLGRENSVKRLVFSGRSINLSLADTIDLLALCIDHKIELPFSDIMEKWHHKIKLADECLQQEINARNYAKVITHTYGLDAVKKWIENNKSKAAVFDDKFFEGIAEACKPEEIERFVQKKSLDRDEAIILAVALSLSSDKDKAREIITRILKKSTHASTAPIIIQKAAELQARQEIILPFVEVFIPAKPSRFPYDKEISDLYKLEKNATTLSYCDKEKELDGILQSITKYPLSSARLLQEMMFWLSYVQGKIFAKKSSTSHAEQLFTEFLRFVKHKTVPDIQPRDIDCVRLRTVARRILASLVEQHLELSNKPDLDKLLDAIIQLDHKFAWFFKGMDWVFISTDEVLECLSVLAKKFPNIGAVRRKISQVIQSLPLAGHTSNRVEQLLTRCNLYLQCDMKREAEKSYIGAILCTHAYGYHKDLLLNELNDVACYLNEKTPKDSLRRSADILELTEYLWRVTDHDETRYIPRNVISEVLRHDRAAGIKLLKQFHDEGFTLAYFQGVESTINNLKGASVLLRYLLSEILPYEASHYNDQNWILGLRFAMVRQALSQNEVENAKFMMERIRVFISELDYVDNDWSKEFNELADKLKITCINSNTVKQSDSAVMTNKEKVAIQDGHVEEIIDNFNKLENSKQSEATESLISLLTNKINTLSETELDKIVSFVLSETSMHYAASCLLKDVANRYKELGSIKYKEIMIKAFEIGYGWEGYGVPNRVRWLVELYNQDGTTNLNTIFKSFARDTMERWGPNGSIKRLGQFFLDTEQVDLLRQLYDTVYSFCKDLFRTYDPPTDKYNWLREFREEKLTDEEAILELFKHAGAFEDNGLQALRAISSSKDIRNYVELSVYDIIEGNTQ